MESNIQQIRLNGGVPKITPEGYNGSIREAALALRFLAENERPAFGNDRFNSESLHLIAEGLDKTINLLGAQSIQNLNLAFEKAAKFDAINTPEIKDFIKAVENEALHQRDRWGSEHDAGKTDADWFWLIGYLAGKAITKPEKALHHIITTAAACLNWHAAKIGSHNCMRPGIKNPEEK